MAKLICQQCQKVYDVPDGETCPRCGMKFLIEPVGSPQEGLKQTFSEPSDNTLLVNEYIHRYGDLDDFFTKSNVTRLTEATEKQ